jgi:hypothetical protein
MRRIFIMENSNDNKRWRSSVAKQAQSRRKSGPATVAFINAGMVAGVSLFTDYEKPARSQSIQNTWDVGRSPGRRRRKQLQSKFLHVMPDIKEADGKVGRG